MIKRGNKLLEDQQRNMFKILINKEIKNLEFYSPKADYETHVEDMEFDFWNYEQ